jgi:hypothetical protein
LATHRSVGAMQVRVFRVRKYESDFKCSCPGHDEADLLVELARLAHVHVEVSNIVQYNEDGHAQFTVAGGTIPHVLQIARRKYYFPPSELIDYLNGRLHASGSRLRYAALKDGVSELVAAGEPEALRNHGTLVYPERL